MSESVVNENSTAYLTVSFLDKNGAAAQPTSTKYEVVDDKNNVLDSGSLSPTGGVAELTLTSDVNAMQDASKDREGRLVSVEATYGAGDALASEYRYELKNLHRVPLS